MGDLVMAKVVCEKCGSNFPLKIIIEKGVETCPMCNCPLFDEIEVESKGADVEIDEIAESDPDLYFYDIDKPGESEYNEQGAVWCQCTSCRQVNIISYDEVDSINKDYVILKKDLGLTCDGCGKQISNIIVPRRPDGWFLLGGQSNVQPKCITCGSTNIKKISTASKVGSVAMWGLLSRKVHKQWHCNACGSGW